MSNTPKTRLKRLHIAFSLFPAVLCAATGIIIMRLYPAYYAACASKNSVLPFYRQDGFYFLVWLGAIVCCTAAAKHGQKALQPFVKDPPALVKSRRIAHIAAAVCCGFILLGLLMHIPK